jgi:Ca2+-binding EF-hand superfamily protein
MKPVLVLGLGSLIAMVAATTILAQPDAPPDRPGERPGRQRAERNEGGNRGERGPGGPGFGGGPGGFGGPGFGGPGGFGGQELAILKEFDKNSNGYLDKDERVAAREFLKKQPAGGRGGPGGGPGGRGGMRGFNPGAMMAKPLLETLDTNKDGKLSAEELKDGAKRLVAEVDKAENATLDQAKLAEVLGRIMPPPQFGGPGGGPGGGGPGDGGRGNGGPGGEPGRGRGGRPALESETPKDRSEPEAKPVQNSERPPRREVRPAGGPNGGQAGGGPGSGPGRGPGGPGGFGGFGGGFGPGNMIAGSILQRADANKDGKVTADELVTASSALFNEVDKDKDGELNEEELAAGVALLFPRPGGFGGPGGSREPGKPGPKVAVADAKTYGTENLFDPHVLRTLFLEFEDADWEAELAEFHNTDVEVPATVIVDGKKLSNVGVTFRGMSSYGMVPAGSKRSFNLSVDMVDGKQRLLGYKTLNLLNAHEDPSLMSTVLYSHIARKHIPAPKANFVNVVVNGESWGLYVNTQQFNKEFLAENYANAKGTRWKVRGSPGGGGGLEYFGDNIEDYKRRYQMKTDESDKAWKAFINLCKVLNETPPDQLEAALKPTLNIDETLWFLALDVALINNDGYWVRASDFSIYLDGKGIFHIIPHDMNEAFHGAMGGPGGGGPGGGRGGPGGPGGGPGGNRGSGSGGGGPGGPPFGGFGAGFGGGPRGSGLELDPLVALDDARKPLRSKLLAVPSLKERYLSYVRKIAEEDLNWETLSPVVVQYRELIEGEVKADTRKLTSFGEFEAAMSDMAEAGGPPEGRRRASLRSFAEARRKYLLSYKEPQKEKPAVDKAEEK